ncbi:MAG TPA: hemerythrin domain-containing protein [Ignavibacteria bacterium]|nr:hemerythrin domain-containing protein [Ignavibacteria bacterium]
MKRHKNLIGLSHDHHHGLRLAQLIKKDAPVYKDLPNDVEGKISYTIKAWKEELNYHFKNEEEILFPAVENRDEKIDELIDELLVEHEEIEYKISQLKTSSEKEEILNDLGYILEQHIRKEERELFDRIQEVFGEDELDNLIDKIEPVK